MKRLHEVCLIACLCFVCVCVLFFVLCYCDGLSTVFFCCGPCMSPWWTHVSHAQPVSLTASFDDDASSSASVHGAPAPPAPKTVAVPRVGAVDVRGAQPGRVLPDPAWTGRSDGLSVMSLAKKRVSFGGGPGSHAAVAGQAPEHEAPAARGASEAGRSSVQDYGDDFEATSPSRHSRPPSSASTAPPEGQCSLCNGKQSNSYM